MDPADAHLIGPRPKSVRCARCRKRFAIKPIGRIPNFCSKRCKQNAFERLARLRRPKPGPQHVPVVELAAQRIWAALIDVGVIPPSTALPPKREPEPKPE